MGLEVMERRSSTYALTAQGRSLGPVLKAIGQWGVHLMVTEKAGDAFQAHWMAYAAESFTVDGDPDAAPVSVQLISGDNFAVIELDGGEVRSRVGRAAAPELTLDGPPRTVLGLLAGMIDLDQATASGLKVMGNPDVLARLRPE